MQKGEQHGADVEGLEYDLEALDVGFRTFDISSARSAAAIWKEGSGLSLGDRACLALAGAVSGSAVTADRRWTHAEPEIRVRLIR